jgi:hypothetical protein
MSELAGIDIAEEGWDSEMVACPFVYWQQAEFYMVYNGNALGRSGFGYALANPAHSREGSMAVQTPEHLSRLAVPLVANAIIAIHAP